MQNTLSPLPERPQTPARRPAAPTRPAAPESAEETALQKIFSIADIRLDGSRPWDIEVRDQRFYRRVVSHGLHGLGESYGEGWWDCANLEEMCFRATWHKIEERLTPRLGLVVDVALSQVIHGHATDPVGDVARNLADLENDFVAALWDPSRRYSASGFRHSGELAAVQRQKMAAVAEQLGLRRGMRVLDIGCGWGGFARYAAETHGCHVVGVAATAAQQSAAQRHCVGLPVEIRLQAAERGEAAFDRVVSLGMTAHAGFREYRSLLVQAAGSMREDGLFLCHAVAATGATRRAEPWVTRTLYPDTMLPVAPCVLDAAEGVLSLEDVRNVGPQVVLTLRKWHEMIRSGAVGTHAAERASCPRVWSFYLQSCAAAIRARSMQVFQFLFSRETLAA